MNKKSDEVRKEEKMYWKGNKYESNNINRRN